MATPIKKLITNAKSQHKTGFRVTGIAIQYAAICERELWFYLNEVPINRTNKHIRKGSRIDDTAFSDTREKLNLGMISPDMVENGAIAEIKPSQNPLEKGRRRQLQYYLWYFKHILDEERDGVLIYPNQSKREQIQLTDDAESNIESLIKRVYEVQQKETPPQLHEKPFCSNCAYHDFCKL